MRIRAALLILWMTFPPFALGQSPNAPNLSTKPETAQPVADTWQTGRAELTAADVEAFLDGIVPQQLTRDDVAGATVAIVKDGKVLFAKGYGYADVANKKPVVANETLFRPGSISKLFTWTAVMQLVEQGKLDLDRDVNEYIDYKIPEAFGKPITLKNLLTHTPGFEESIKDLITFKQDSPDLGQYLKTHIPRRIFPPGTVPAYSNYGASLAGYIVERVSSEPFNTYVTEHIFKPLNMSHSTFAQPLSPELASKMSLGYTIASEKPLEAFEVVTPFPAGSLSSSADDMSRFMLAHLQEGRLGDIQILKPETAKLMHSRLFGLDPAANAMAYGFYEENRNGRRIVGHAGDTGAFHSDLHLVLDAGVGFFVSYNSAGRGQVSPRTILWEAFLDRYFPFSPPTATVSESSKQDIAAVSGTYESSRRPEGSFFKAFSLLSESTVAPTEDGMIEVDALLAPNGKPKRWQAIAPMQFREVGGQDLLVFKPDENGRMQMIIPYPFMTFQRVGLWQNSKVLLPVLVLSLIVMLLTLVFWFVGWIVRRHYGGTFELTRTEWWLRVGVRAAFALALVFLTSMVSLLMYAISNLDFLSDAGVIWFQMAQAIGVIATIGTLVVFFHAIYAWISKRYRIWGKLQATVFALACVGFLWFVFASHSLYFTSTF
ncbi:MAG: beta-lactamase family protein [Chloracidobacterium sp.]|nr:beta-lactamase family protein [Chloracidobacterium sp.]